MRNPYFVLGRFNAQFAESITALRDVHLNSKSDSHTMSCKNLMKRKCDFIFSFLIFRLTLKLEF